MKTLPITSSQVADGLVRKTLAYASKALSKSTRRAYRSDWLDFCFWCGRNDLQGLPAAPDTVALYITALADHATLSTIRRRLITISQAHKTTWRDNPVSNPAVRTTLRGIVRSFAAEKKIITRKAPLLLDDLRSILAKIPGETPRGKRDRALLLLGFAGAFRRSELVGLDVKDVTFSREGAVARIGRSKTDQEGVGFEKAIPFGRIEETCPVLALKAWIEVAGITSGPLFRSIRKGGIIQAGRLSDKAVSLVIKEAAENAGIDASKLSGHSLRAGFVTEALIRGATYAHVQRQTGHKSLAMVGAYDRDSARFRNNAVTMLGL